MMGSCAKHGSPSPGRRHEPPPRHANPIGAPPVIEGEVTIVNALGLHARAAAKFVNLAKTFTANIELELGDKRVDGKSIMNVMLLAAAQGTVLTLRASGADEAEAFPALAGLIAERFGEEE